MKKSILFKVITFAFLFIILSLQSLTAQNMVPYTTEDGNLSFYCPEGWTAEINEDGISLFEDPYNPLSTGMDFYIVPLGDNQIGSLDLVNILAEGVRETYPDLQIIEANQASQSPDVSGITFAYTVNNNKINGFGLSMCQGDIAIWADVYGTPEKLSVYDPSYLLSCFLQSINQGPEPGEIQIEAGSYEPEVNETSYNQAMEESATMTHFWNNMPNIVPDAFAVPDMSPGYYY